jgi:malate dehydrogenase (oxaloacetate-decarboxylating)(NADP+)
MAYSPGVAFACEEIVADPGEAQHADRARQPGRGHHQRHRRPRPRRDRPARRQAGDGRQGVLFKKFANIDVFDIEIDERDPDKLIDTIASLEPTFGGINLEDIKAPRVLLHREEAARADEDSGLPRRPARHGDRRRRRHLNGCT